MNVSTDLRPPPAPARPRGSQPAWREASVRRALVAWVVASASVVLLADELPFDWPARTGRSVLDHVLDANVAMAQVLVLMGIVVLLTRGRWTPDLIARTPERATARFETLLLLAYGAAGLGVGYALARSLGWHPFGLHLAGTLYGTHEPVETAEVVIWAVFNLVVYAVVPLTVLRRRYSFMQLSLRSTDRRNDRLVILVVVAIESLTQVVALEPAILDLSPRQLLIGVPVTFALYLIGTVLPAMVFVYAILVPRFLRLTGSTATTVILGGVTYAALHLWDAWAVFSSPSEAGLSVAFLALTYLGPGMMKTLLTVRTGNAWVHAWAYHAFAPHTLIDTPHLVKVFGLR